MSQDPSAEIDSRLEALETSLAEYRNQQQANTASLATLQNLTSELLDIARLHQQALRLSQRKADEDRDTIREMQREVRQMQQEVQQVWEYLLGQQRNGDSGSEYD